MNYSVYLVLVFEKGKTHKPCLVKIERGDNPAWPGWVSQLEKFREQQSMLRSCTHNLMHHAIVLPLTHDGVNFAKFDAKLITEYELEHGPRDEWSQFDNADDLFTFIQYNPRSRTYFK